MGVRRSDEARAARRPIVVLAAVFVVVIAACASFVAWDRVWRRAGPSDPGMSCPIVVKAHQRLPLAAIGVHRVALIGDSIMFQPSCAAADSLANVGVTTYRHAVPGSGLLTGTVDWVTQMRRILHDDRPDVVVAIFVGNYPPPPLKDGTGKPILAGTPEFFAAWQRSAEKLAAEVASAGAQMYWVSPPPIEVPVLSYASRLFDGYRRITHTHVLDSGRVLAGAGGREVFTQETCGRRRTVRSLIDGVHLTNDGARIYGQQIAHDLTAEIGIMTAPKPC